MDVGTKYTFFQRRYPDGQQVHDKVLNITNHQGNANQNLIPVRMGVIKKTKEGLPWWHSGQESACQCRGHEFKPWSRKIPHVTEQLSPCATTTEPALQSPQATTTEACMPQLLKPTCLEPVLCNKRSHRNQKSAHCDEEQPPLATTRKSPREAMKTQCSQK